MDAGTMSRFQWKLYDGGEQRWSRKHAAEGTCPSCCCNGPVACPECGGRYHREPVEGMTPDGWEPVHASYCQQERADDTGEKPETREVGP